MLDLYSLNEDTSEFIRHSKNGLQSNPAQTTHDGTNGEVVEQKLYLRADDDNFWYENLTLQALPLIKTAVGDVNYPEAFIGFKIIVQNEQPTANAWAATASGNQASFQDIGSPGDGDIGYKPFWVQVTIPSGTRVQNITDVSIHVAGDENPV